MLDSLQSAHDAGYVHGLIVMGLVGAALFLAVVLAWFATIPLERPDPDYTADPSRHHSVPESHD
jgi:hypothetical protein